MGSSGGTPAAVLALTGNLLTTGQESMSRDLISSTGVPGSTGSLRFAFFTARKGETTTQVRVYSGATAAAATPTLCRVGLWLVAANGDLTLVASTANDTTLFAATNTSYTRSWSVAYAMVAGQRYSTGSLVVTAGTANSWVGQTISQAEEVNVATRLCGVVSGQADLPASVAAGSLVASGSRPYLVVLP